MTRFEMEFSQHLPGNTGWDPDPSVCVSLLNYEIQIWVCVSLDSTMRARSECECLSTHKWPPPPLLGSGDIALLFSCMTGDSPGITISLVLLLSLVLHNNYSGIHFVLSVWDLFSQKSWLTKADFTTLRFCKRRMGPIRSNCVSMPIWWNSTLQYLRLSNSS